MEIEQIDGDHLAGLPEERLRHYNEILSEQLKTLEAEVEERLAPLRMEFGFAPWGELTIGEMDAALDERIAETRGFRGQLESDLQALDHPQRRRALLKRLAEAERGDDLDFLDAMAAMAEMFDPPPFSPARGRGGKKRR